MAYPDTIPVFTDLINDVDDVLAEHQNDPNDVITSIATMLGVVGASQSYSLDVLDYLANRHDPLLTKASANSLKVAVGAAVLKNAAQSKKFLKRTVADITVTASNIDTGAMAIGYYYVYLIGDAAATTFTVKFSTSATNPNVAAGLIYELIGWFYNEAGGSMDVTSGFVGNIKRNGRSGPSVSVINNTTADTIDDTVYGNDLTGCAIKMYFSGRPVIVLAHLESDAANWMDNDLAFILDVDGTDEAGSESMSASGKASAAGVRMVYVFTPAAGTHTLTLQAKVAASSDKVTRKHFAVIEL